MTCNWYRWVSCFKDWYAVLLQSQLVFKMGIRLLQRTLKKYAFKKINFVYLLQGSWKLIRCLERETRALYSSKWFKRQNEAHDSIFADSISLNIPNPTSSLSAHGDSYSKNVTTMSIYNCKNAYLYEPIAKRKRSNLFDILMTSQWKSYAFIPWQLHYFKHYNRKYK